MNNEHKPWLDYYPEGVPAEISIDPPVSLVDLLNEACTKHADRVALNFMGAQMRYSEVDQQAYLLASWLQAQDIKAGSRIAIMMPNTLVNLCILFGVLRAGMVVVNINPQYTPPELERQLQDCQPDAIFILENFAHVLAQLSPHARPGHIVISAAGDGMGLRGVAVNAAARYLKRMIKPYQLPGSYSYAQVLSQGKQNTFVSPNIHADDIALLQYTGGTTGEPKGACLTHANLGANIAQIKAVAYPVLGDFSGPQQTILCALPLYHIFALTLCGLLGLQTGMRIVLISDPRDLNSIIRAWRAHPPTIFPSVNTLYNALSSNTSFVKLDFSQLALCFGGGSAVQQAVAERWLSVTGRSLIEGYGLSETSPVVTANPTDSTEYSGNIGFPVPSTLVRFLGENDEDVPPGEMGELAIKGPQVMLGYWKRPGETAEAFTSDGYFKSGDIAVMDKTGRITLVDRKKDMILVSGFNVYPNEIEEVLMSHPGVHEAAVVGIASEHSGEAVKAFVVRSDPELTEQALKQWSRERLTAYKRPRSIEFRESLPKSNVGKILRRTLRDEEAASN